MRLCCAWLRWQNKKKKEETKNTVRLNEHGKVNVSELRPFSLWSSVSDGLFHRDQRQRLRGGECLSHDATVPISGRAQRRRRKRLPRSQPTSSHAPSDSVSLSLSEFNHAKWWIIKPFITTVCLPRWFEMAFLHGRDAQIGNLWYKFLSHVHHSPVSRFCVRVRAASRPQRPRLCPCPSSTTPSGKYRYIELNNL
jgi:hypothetical protein